MPDSVPFRDEREASAAARAVIPPEPGEVILSQAQRDEVLHRALAESGVATSALEDRTAWWLANWEDYVIGIIVRWITSAYEAGKASALDSTVADAEDAGETGE